MLDLKLSMLIFAIGLFATMLSVVAHDVYSAIRLRWLVEQPDRHHHGASVKPLRHAAAFLIFGGTGRARPFSQKRRPQPLWVARFASREERS